MSQPTAPDLLFQKLQAISGDAAPPIDTLFSPAGKNLARRFQLCGDTLTAAASAYSISERHRIVQQLRIGLTEFYVHLERKRVQYGFDAVRSLELLEPSIDALTDGEFQQSIVQLIARTRDRHLVFWGRDPLGASAVLPFTIERFFEGQIEKFALTKIAAGFTPQYLRVGAIVTHWNGIRIDRFVRLNANVFDGSHDAAAIAKSLVFLTSRWLRRFAPPLEDWVDLDFAIDGTSYCERFNWSGVTTDIPVTPSIGRNVIGFGEDFDLLVAQQIRRVQFSPHRLTKCRLRRPVNLACPRSSVATSSSEIICRSTSSNMVG